VPYYGKRSEKKRRDASRKYYNKKIYSKMNAPPQGLESRCKIKKYHYVKKEKNYVFGKIKNVGKKLPRNNLGQNV